MGPKRYVRVRGTQPISVKSHIHVDMHLHAPFLSHFVLNFLS